MHSGYSYLPSRPDGERSLIRTSIGISRIDATLGGVAKVSKFLWSIGVIEGIVGALNEGPCCIEQGAYTRPSMLYPSAMCLPSKRVGQKILNGEPNT